MATRHCKWEVWQFNRPHYHDILNFLQPLIPAYSRILFPSFLSTARSRPQQPKLGRQTRAEQGKMLQKITQHPKFPEIVQSAYPEIEANQLDVATEILTIVINNSYLKKHSFMSKKDQLIWSFTKESEHNKVRLSLAFHAFIELTEGIDYSVIRTSLRYAIDYWAFYDAALMASGNPTITPYGYTPNPAFLFARHLTLRKLFDLPKPDCLDYYDASRYYRATYKRLTQEIAPSDDESSFLNDNPHILAFIAERNQDDIYTMLESANALALPAGVEIEMSVRNSR